jgi:ferritin
MHDGYHGHSHEEKNGDASVMSKSKLKAILSYMKEHNREHANELHGLLGFIKELDADEILDLIENGAKSIEEAAEQIEQALELLEEL